MAVTVVTASMRFVSSWVVAAVFAACVALIGAWVAAAPTHAEPVEPRCLRSGERVVLATNQVVVARKRNRYRACWRASGRRSRLIGRPTHIRINGRFVGYVRRSFSISGGGSYIAQSVDVRSGRPWVAGEAYYPPRNRADDIGAVTDLEVTANGELAWLVRNPVRSPPNAIGLYVLRRPTVNAIGPQKPLDPGPNIDPTSLALAGDSIYWMRDGVAQTRRVSTVPRPS